MSKILILALALVSLSLSAATPNVRVTVTDFCDVCSGVGNTVRLTPGSAVSAVNPSNLVGVSDSSARITFANVPAGFYTLGIDGIASISIKVPNQSGTLEASDMVNQQWDRPKRSTSTLKPDLFRGVPYLWPSAQGAGSLTNDGNGNLNWGLVSGGESQWTNDSGNIYPSGTTNGSFAVNTNDGSLAMAGNITVYGLADPKFTVTQDSQQTTATIGFDSSHDNGITELDVSSGNGSAKAMIKSQDLEDQFPGRNYSAIELRAPGKTTMYLGTGYGYDSISYGDFYADAAGNVNGQDMYLLAKSSIPQTPQGFDGFLWNSNKVLYWVTTTKTNLVNDGR